MSFIALQNKIFVKYRQNWQHGCQDAYITDILSYNLADM